MRAIGYARVSTDKQADRGVSLEAQTERIRAMAVVQDADLVDERKVDAVIVAKVDRLTRSVKDLGNLLEHFEKRGVALVSVAESLDTGPAAGRLVITIMTAVSQWEREASGRAR